MYSEATTPVTPMLWVHTVPVAVDPEAVREVSWVHPATRALPQGLPEELRCGYTSKRCENPRTVKRSGGLHRFCAFHRERANKNQWRVDHRRRMERAAEAAAARRLQEGNDQEDPSQPEGKNTRRPFHTLHSTVLQVPGDLDEAYRRPLDGSSPDLLSDRDATILSMLLFGDEDDDPIHVLAAGAVDSTPLHHLQVEHWTDPPAATNS